VNVDETASRTLRAAARFMLVCIAVTVALAGVVAVGPVAAASARDEDPTAGDGEVGGTSMAILVVVPPHDLPSPTPSASPSPSPSASPAGSGPGNEGTEPPHAGDLLPQTGDQFIGLLAFTAIAALLLAAGAALRSSSRRRT